MRGSWQVKLYADPKGASHRRDLGAGRGFRAGAACLRPHHRRQGDRARTSRSPSTSRRAISTARTAPGLPIDGDIDVTPVDTLAGFPGYHLRPRRRQRRADPPADRPRRDDRRRRQGDARRRRCRKLPVVHPSPRRRRSSCASPTPTAGPSSGRSTLPVTAGDPLIGIKPLFDGDEVDEGATAGLRRHPGRRREGERIAGTGLTWTPRPARDGLSVVPGERQLELRADHHAAPDRLRHDRRSADGRRRRSRRRSTGADYRLTVERTGDEPAATSFEFYAGWYVAVGEVRDARRAGRRPRQAGLQDRRDGEAPARSALCRHRADQRHRRPADRHEGGRRAGGRHHRRPRGHRRMGSRRLCHRGALPADGRPGQAHAGPRARPDLGQGRAGRPRPRRRARRRRRDAAAPGR